MGNSILEELWYRNINPQEECSEKKQSGQRPAETYGSQPGSAERCHDGGAA